jgi:predicted AlkP superfamily pyrophosphatase or phosphodiesterase
MTIRPVVPAVVPALAALLLAAPSLAEDAAPANPPELVVAISVDQFSADLFAQYREHYRGGLARLLTGAVFPSGYQSHAATETCPGHSTIMTGARPARTGIIANEWLTKDASGKLASVYCAEDEANKPAEGPYTPSAVHLLVPTLGEMVKQAWPGAKNVAVSGKDRGALMMGGQDVDPIYFRWGNGFGTIAGREVGPQAKGVSERVGSLIAAGAPAMLVPAWCEAADRAIPLGKFEVGAGHFAIRPGKANDFIRSPRFDQATLELAGQLVEGEKLGADQVPDVLSVSLSATDYVGHAYGTNGVESCVQVAALDDMLGQFFEMLDSRGIDYIAVLTADHGGIDLPERAREQAVPAAHRIDASAIVAGLEAATRLKAGGLAAPPSAGDVWLVPALAPADRAKAIAALKALPASNPDVAAVFTAEELAAAPLPKGEPGAWSLLDRARASYHPGRSGDVVVLLAPGVSPIPGPREGIVATHGSPYDYDRRVPILFWRKGLVHFEQPYPVETVDIAPTLAAILGLPVEQGTFDGRCLDLDSSSRSTCK